MLSSQRLQNQIAKLDFSLLTKQDFLITTDRLSYHCQFQAFPGTDRLFVSLRSSTAAPTFNEDHFQAGVNGHVLAISDPSLLLSAEVEIGAFYGTAQEDAVFGIIRIAEKVAATFGLERTRIIYWGVSGCALGAAMAAIKSGTSAILVNPLLDARNMSGSRNADAIAKAFGAAFAQELNDQYPLRTRTTEAIAAAEALGIYSKLLLVQNTSDGSFFKRQFTPFCQNMGVPLDGGINASGRIRSMIYTHPSGHAPEPNEFRSQILNEGVPWLLETVASQAVPGRGFFDVVLNRTGTSVFGIPADATHVRLMSRSSVVLPDTRVLGAAISKIEVDSDVIAIDDPSLVLGFHALENDAEKKWRWTGGIAILPLPRYGHSRKLKIEVILLASDEF